MIIVPHHFMLEKVVDSFGRRDVLVDHPRSTPAKQFKNYQAILSGDHHVVIGTRKTLFRRIGNYDRIIYLHDGLAQTHTFYKHKVETFWIAGQLASYGKQVHILTNVPSVNNMYHMLIEQSS